MNPLFFLAFLGGLSAMFGSSDEGSEVSSVSNGRSDDPTPPPTANALAPAPTPPAAPVVEDNDDAEDVANIEVVNQAPAPPEQIGDGGAGGETAPVAAEGALSVIGGRVTTLEPLGDDVVDVRIISNVDHGKVTVNPDNTMALVLTQSDYTGADSFTYEVTASNGTTTTHQIDLNVTPTIQEQGWGTSETHYMLETDANDRVIVETGEVHTKVYVSGSSDAFSVADIAAREGLNVDQITGNWLIAHGGYGQNEDMALAEDAANLMWAKLNPEGSTSSNWMLLERGYAYDDFNPYLKTGNGGEDELHPKYFGAWGDGDDPVITNHIRSIREADNVVFQDLDFQGGVFVLNAENWIFDNTTFTKAGASVQLSEGITVRNSEFYDISHDDPVRVTDDGQWSLHASRIQGLYSDRTDGFLLENTLFDRNGWQEGYTGDADDPAPPSQYNHNIYFGTQLTDVTIRDTITMRGSSFGIMNRSGGFIEDNLILDNNAGFRTYGGGGDYNGEGPTGNYTLLSNNVVTSAAHKTGTQIGALSYGLIDGGEMTTLVDNIVAHLADPNNPDEFAEKEFYQTSVQTKSAYYDDTIVYNWFGSRVYTNPIDFAIEQNVEGLDETVLDQTTIQIFTQQLLGDENATIADLADYLRAQADGAFDDIVDADLIIRFFQEGFGLATDIRDSSETLRFVPNDLGDGVRWDNRLNWDTNDLPGLHATDNVDLGGNQVVYGGNTTIDTLDLSNGGKLDFYHGKLTTGWLVSEDEGFIDINEAGQLWADGSRGDGEINIDVEGGRFANTGEAENINLTAHDGQSILATGGAEYDVNAGHTLEILSAEAKVGFDGDDGGIAILDLHEDATLRYNAEDGELGTIEEFRSGAFGDAPDVRSGIDLGNATLEIDLSGLNATAAGTQLTLMDSDELVGLFDEAVIGGLGARDATIVIDYVTDSVTLQLTPGSGGVSIETLGEETDVDAGEEELWAALTADQPVMSETASATFSEEEEDALEMVA